MPAPPGPFRTVQTMEQSVERSHRRGFGMLELIVVIVLMGILSTIGAVTYQAIVGNTKNTSAASGISALAGAEQVWYQTHGAFAVLPSDLTAMDSSYTYVDADTASTGPGVISVGTSGTQAALAALSPTGSCQYQVVNPPSSSTPDSSGSFPAGSTTPCTATQAFEQ